MWPRKRLRAQDRSLNVLKQTISLFRIPSLLDASHHSHLLGPHENPLRANSSLTGICTGRPSFYRLVEPGFVCLGKGPTPFYPMGRGLHWFICCTTRVVRYCLFCGGSMVMQVVE